MKLKNINVIQMIVQTFMRIVDYILTTIALQLGAIEMSYLGFTTFSKILVTVMLIMLWCSTAILHKWNDKPVNIAFAIILGIVNISMSFVIINNCIQLSTILK